MKVLHVVPSYLPAVRYGGPIYSVHGLCRALVGLGHEVHVFTTSMDGESDSDVVLGEPVDLGGVQVWYFPSKCLRRLYYSPPILRMLRERIHDFDLVHLHSVFLWPTWAAARVARKAGIPYVLSPRGMLVMELVRRKSYLLKRCWIFLIEKSTLARAACIHLTSKKEADELARFAFQTRRTAVIPNGVALPENWTGRRLSDDVEKIIGEEGRYVLFLGRLNWKKGIDRLIRTWKEVPGEKLVVAGNDEEGYLGELTALARKEGVLDRVTFLPRLVTGPDKEALFASARLFVLPSCSENFGMTVLEAMIREVPVVVTEEVGAAEIVRKAGAGKVVAAQDLGSGIVSMLQDDRGLEIMGLAGKQHVEHFYGWDRIGREMIGLYQRVARA